MELRLVKAVNGWVGKCFPFDLFMDFVARFGHWLFVLYGVWLWCGGDGARRGERRTCALFALAAVVISSVISFCIGKLWARPRPFAADERIWNFTAHRANASFPSNHTMNAAAVVFSLFAFRMPGWLAMAGLAVLLALSRVYAGIHYVTDLLGGAAVAAAVTAGLSRWAAFGRAARTVSELSLLAEALYACLRRRG